MAYIVFVFNHIPVVVDPDLPYCFSVYMNFDNYTPGSELTVSAQCDNLEKTWPIDEPFHGTGWYAVGAGILGGSTPGVVNEILLSASDEGGAGTLLVSHPTLYQASDCSIILSTPAGYLPDLPSSNLLPPFSSNIESANTTPPGPYGPLWEWSMCGDYLDCCGECLAPLPPVSQRIIVRKVTSPSGSPQSFTFTPSWGTPFALTDGESNDSGTLEPGTYSVVEAPITGWETTVSQDPSTIVLRTGETVTITFFNSTIPLAGGWVCANVPIKFTLDSSGNVPSGSKIWSNAELVQGPFDKVMQRGTYYTVKVFDANGLPVSGFPVVWIFTNLTGDIQDLSGMVNQVSSV